MLRLRVRWLLTLACFGPLALAGPQDDSKGQEKQRVENEEPERPLPQSFEVTVEGRVTPAVIEATGLTKGITSPHETPGSLAVVERPQIEVQAARTLGDAIAGISGINVQSNFGVHDLFFIRGFDSLSSGMLLMDGAMDPESTFFDLYNVERIEVLKGPAAFLYGGSPLAGAVNIVRREPQPLRLASSSISFGSFESLRAETDLNLGSPGSPVAFRINAIGQRSEGYRDRTRNHLLGVNPTLNWNLTDRTSLSLGFEYVTSSYRPDSGLPLVGNQLPDVPRTRSYASPFDRSQQEMLRFRFDWNSQLSESLELRNKFFYSDLDWRTDGTLLVGVIPSLSGELSVLRVLNLLDDRQRLFGNQFELAYTFRTGGVRHEILTGVEVSRLADKYALDVAGLPPISLTHPEETAAGLPPLIPGQSSASDSRNWVFAPYVLDRMVLGEKLQVFAGGRLDVLDFEDQLNRFQSNSSQFNPMLGLTVTPEPSLALYASASTAFAPPSTLVIGDREPEESFQVEAGAKKDFFNRRLYTTLAFYQLEKESIAIPTESGFLGRLGSQRSRGMEFETAFLLSESWRGQFQYTFNSSVLTRFSETELVGLFPPEYAIVDRSGNAAPFAPRHLFSLWSQKDFGTGLGIGGGLRFIDEQFIAPDNQFRIGRYLLLDAALYYRADTWSFRLNLQNLTNQEFETRGFGTNSVIPGEGFGIFGTIEFPM